jgi:undecaprenyl-phosphate 4-deoxy-4-formamido-L-arabinose transferase
VQVSVVVPCYRSGGTLPELVARLSQVLPTCTTAYEVVLVVDGSPDDTWDVAARLAATSPGVRAVRLMRNYGQHNALLAGIGRTRYDVVVTMDDDLQHPPEEIPGMLASLADPAVDLVYGVAVEEEHGVLRSLASRGVKRGLAVAGVPNADDVSAFRAFRGELRHGFAHVADAYVSIDVLLSWVTTAVARRNVRMDKRTAGRSNYSVRSLARHALNMVTGYSEGPLRIVTYLGIICGLLGVGLLGVVLFKFVTGTTQVAGFTTIASMVALFSGAQMLSIGVLGEYVGRLHFRSMQKPSYVVRTEVEPGTAVPAPAETLPDGPLAVEALPAETRPVESGPAEALPVESGPAETLPVESRPADSRPAERQA